MEEILQINKIFFIRAGFVSGSTMAVIASKFPNINVVVIDVNKKNYDWNNKDFDKLLVKKLDSHK